MTTIHSATPTRRRRLGALSVAVLVGASAALVTTAPLATPAGAVAVPAATAEPMSPLTSGTVDWGVRAGLRSYIVNPALADGAITVSGGATTNPDGTFHFPAEPGSSATGSVRFEGHDGALDIEISNPRVEVLDSTSGVLVADVVARPFAGFDAPPQPAETYDDVDLASLDLSAAGVIVDDTATKRTYSNVPAKLTEDGVPAFGGFYAENESLDPVNVEMVKPTITVERTGTNPAGINPLGETITVSGTGFNPNASISSRVPVTVGQPSGFYVVFGKFADVWQPSLGSTAAPSSSRQMIDQKWPLPEASKNQVAGQYPGQAAQLVLLNPDGSFTTTLFVREDATKTNPNYGIATYSASTSNYAAEVETFTPVTFAPSPFSDIAAGHGFLEEINWMASAGLATGFEDGTFRPVTPVARQAAASFLWRLAGSPEPAEDAPRFSDVPETHVFFDAISWLAGEGIAKGYADGTFRPSASVTRQAAAAFLWGVADSPEPAEDAPRFSDVPETHVFFDAISWLADEGITTGYQDGTFRPSTVLNRQAMAAFLFRSLSER